MKSIITATTTRHYEEFAAMISEYVEWCRERYAGNGRFVAEVFDHQSLDDELLDLPFRYGRPRGRTLLALSEGKMTGCIAYREMSLGVCEMKRLFVRKDARGDGSGRRLCLALIDAAREDGYALMRLDTASLLTEAIALYRSVGFAECPAYNDYPDDLMPHIVFMEMPLGPKAVPLSGSML